MDSMNVDDLYEELARVQANHRATLAAATHPLNQTTATALANMSRTMQRIVDALTIAGADPAEVRARLMKGQGR